MIASMSHFVTMFPRPMPTRVLVPPKFVCSKNRYREEQYIPSLEPTHPVALSATRTTSFRVNSRRKLGALFLLVKYEFNKKKHKANNGNWQGYQKNGHQPNI